LFDARPTSWEYRLAMQNPARYTVTAIIHTRGDVTRRPMGAAPSRRKARRLGYRFGEDHAPSRFSSAIFELEIIDTATGQRVRARWAEDEALDRRDRQMTVGERGVW
jgi:hypothetical protein